jgi:hypothetical protein
MKLAMQQSQDLARARKCIEAMLGGEGKPAEKEPKKNSEKGRPSPIKNKSDIKAQFSDPPAPPPQAPLPEKPDVARALADPLIQPLLRRPESSRPSSANSSPTRTDHSGDILRLCEELKLAKGELSSQAERMKGLESQLALEPGKVPSHVPSDLRAAIGQKLLRMALKKRRNMVLRNRMMKVLPRTLQIYMISLNASRSVWMR